MDDILQSIRAIIAETPLVASLTLGPPAVHNSRAASRAKSGSTLAHVQSDRRVANGSSPLSVAPKPVRDARRAQNSDDVLSRILAPAVGLVPGDVGTGEQAGVENPVPVVATAGAVVVACADTGASFDPAAPTEVLTVGLEHSLAEPECVAPPEMEIRAAADVLGALALGLAAAVPSVLAPGAEPACLVVDAAAHVSPAAAAAAAVAEVAAANSHAADPVEETISSSAMDRPAVSMAAAPVGVEAYAPAAVVAPVPVAALPDASTSAPATTPIAVSASATDLVPSSSSSLEDTIAHMLRPLLREWLNANMPRMVEKALKEELAQPGVWKTTAAA